MACYCGHGSEVLVFTVPFALSFSMLTFAALGGNAFASERADRSAEFLAYLPPTRRMVVASKSILALGVSLLIWLVGLTLLYVMAPRLGPVEASLIQFRDDMIPALIPSSVLLLGGAWLGSSFLPSHTLATFFGILVTVALLGALAGIEYAVEPPPFDVGWWYRTLCWPLGAAAFAAGVAIYVRRVEP